MSITVYTQPNCVQCNATFRALDARGIDYEVTDLSTDPDAMEFVKSLGYMQAPVVIVEIDEITEHWSGFQPDRVKSIPVPTSATVAA